MINLKLKIIIPIFCLSLLFSAGYFFSSLHYLERTVFEQTMIFTDDSISDAGNWNPWFKHIFEDKVNSLFKKKFTHNFIRSGIYLHNDKKNKVIMMRIELRPNSNSNTSQIVGSIILDAFHDVVGKEVKVYVTELKVFNFFEDRKKGINKLLQFSVILFLGTLLTLTTIWKKYV